MFKISQRGSFKNTEAFLNNAKKLNIDELLHEYGRFGVDALSNATPTRTGLTAASWYYTVSKKRGTYRIIWRNKNVQDGTPIAVLIQYGHATGNGGYIEGRDFINPAMQPIFDEIAADVWKVVIGR